MGKAAVILEILASPMTAAAKIVMTAAAIIMFNTGGRIAMDYSTLVMPEDCWMTVAVILVPFAILFGVYIAMRSYTEMLNSKKWKASEHPYTLNYALGTILGIILGTGLAFIAAGAIPAYMGITGIPAIVYAFIAVGLALVFVWFFVTIVHRGIETTIKMIRQFAKTVKEEAPGIIEDVTGAVDTVKDSVEKNTNNLKDDQLP